MLGFTFKMQTVPQGHEGPFSNFGRCVEAGTAKLGDCKAASPSLAPGAGDAGPPRVSGAAVW